MTQEVAEKIVDEVIDTLVDKLDEITVDYMFEYGNYEETDEQFVHDLPMFKRAVVTEIYNRLIKYKNVQWNKIKPRNTKE